MLLKRYGFRLLTTLLAGPALAGDKVDTSAWVCEFCPFEEGMQGSFETGVTNVSADSAYFGDATGYDEEGVYLNVDGEGRYRSDEHESRWRVEDLGLDSRLITVEGVSSDRFTYQLDWSELPRRRFFTTSSVFNDSGAASLVLPANWVPAPNTSGFTTLDENLANRAVESDRQTLGIGGSYAVNPRISLSADFRQRNHDGVRMVGGSSFNNASLLPAPFDHSTDEVEVGVRYGDANSFLGLSWHHSDFDNKYDALTWQQPFTAAPGAESPQIAQAPDNRFQQLRLAGAYALTQWHTVLNLSAAIGQIEQDAAFLDYTVNPNLDPDPLPRTSLDGKVNTTNVLLSLNARPTRKLRLRARYRFDERDNRTPIDRYSRVIADVFPSGESEANVPYSYTRRKLSGTAHWDAHRKLRLSSGFEYGHYNRNFQEVSKQDEFISYGRIRLRPLSAIEVDARYGNSRRETDRYDEALAIAQGQNPLLRKYNLAFRFREFMDIRASWSPDSLPIAIGATVLWADDSYTHSMLGLTDGEERGVSLDFNWFFGENASLFLNAGVDDIKSEQLGSESFGGADWNASNEDSFTSWGGGLNIDNIGNRFDLRVSVLSSRGASEIEVQPLGAAVDPFPDIETSLDRLRLDLNYHFSDKLDLTLGAAFQQFEASDWALQGVAPDSVPLLFSLGAEPYDDDNVMIMLGVRYRMGPR